MMTSTLPCRNWRLADVKEAPEIVDRLNKLIVKAGKKLLITGRTTGFALTLGTYDVAVIRI